VGVFKLARRVTTLSFYAADTVLDMSISVSGNGRLVLVPGDPEATEGLRAMLEVPVETRPEPGAVAVFAVSAEGDPEPVAEEMARRAAEGGRSLVVILGSPERRRAVEERLRRAPGVEMSSIVHVARLDRRGEQRVMEGVVRGLGENAIAAGRLNPALRPAVAAQVVSQASSAVGAVSASTARLKGRQKALVALQVKMLGELATVYDRPLDRRRAVDVALVVALGYGWRLAGLGAVALVPAPGSVVRGGVAYGSTQAVGRFARRRFAEGGNLASVDVATIKETLARLRPGASTSPTAKEEAA
jgi:uncharacterized protein (DUF697 family)